jgi:localization factor PodJL
LVEPTSYSTVEAQPAPLPAPIVVDPAAIYADAVELMQSGQAEAGAAAMQRAAEAGHAMAQYRLALAYERGEGVAVDLAAARTWTERAAAGGVVMAMHNLGVYYARGEGASRDEAAAFRWFRQAAEFGVADSQYNLAILYQRGRGVSEDKSEALFWFLLAARQGDAQATARVTELEAVLSPEDARHARARADAFRPRGAPQAEDEGQLTVTVATAG